MKGTLSLSNFLQQGDGHITIGSGYLPGSRRSDKNVAAPPVTSRHQHSQLANLTFTELLGRVLMALRIAHSVLQIAVRRRDVTVSHRAKLLPHGISSNTLCLFPQTPHPPEFRNRLQIDPLPHRDGYDVCAALGNMGSGSPWLEAKPYEVFCRRR